MGLLLSAGAASAESVIAAAPGWLSSCAVTEGGAVKCWGDNEYGQLGDGTTTDRDAPVDVVGLPEAVAVSVGYSFACALSSAGGVWCWGDNYAGQLGDGSTTPHSLPAPVAGLGSGVASISAGAQHACAVTETGDALCWGRNEVGQVGNGTTTENVLVPTPVSGLPAGAQKIAAAQIHTCAVAAGAAWCWGQMNEDSSSVPVAMPGLGSGIVDLAAGDRYASNQRVCARTQGGAVLCSGSWSYPATGVPGLESGVTDLALGGEHACVVMASRAVRCWGRNTYGQLASNVYETDPSEPPVSIYGLPGGALHITAGLFHTCAIVPGNGLRCWGDDREGQVGDGPPPAPTATPLPVVGLASGVTHLSAGVSSPASTCAVANGGAWCWGAFGYGGFPPHIPTRLPGFESGVSDVSDAGGLICVRMSNGAVGCEGTNELVGLGWDPSAGITAIDAGDAHVCGLLPGGGIQCQGGEMRFDDTGAPYPAWWTHTPITSGMVAVEEYCALSAAGAVSCWNTQYGSPVPVSQLASGVASFDAGGWQLCAVTTSGSVRCSSDGYVPVPGISNAIAVSSGREHTCVLLAGGSVHCWGDNSKLQLGVAAPAYSETPIEVPLGFAAVAVSAGVDHTCATDASGGAWCWGANGNGQRGDGSVPLPLVPVPVLGLEGFEVPALGAPWLWMLAAALCGAGALARRRSRVAAPLR